MKYCPNINMQPFKYLNELHSDAPYWFHSISKVYTKKPNFYSLALVDVNVDEEGNSSLGTRYEFSDTELGRNTQLVALYGNENNIIRFENIEEAFIKWLAFESKDSILKEVEQNVVGTINELLAKYNQDEKYSKLLTLASSDLLNSELIINPEFTNRTLASYDSKTNRITLNTKNVAFATVANMLDNGLNTSSRADIKAELTNMLESTLVHEVSHDIVKDIVDRYIAGDTRIDETQKALLDKLQKVYDYTIKFNDNQYGFKDLTEFVSEVIGSKDFRDFLQGIELPQELQETEGKTNFLEYILNLLSELVGLEKTALYTSTQLIDKLLTYNNKIGYKSIINTTSNREINYTLKAVAILQSDKAKQVFEKGKKNNWSLDKILTELAVPKEQKALLLDLGIADREQLISNIKPKDGVSELFESNPELANAVYEALGFKSKPDVILPIGTSGSGKSTFIKSLPQENLVIIEPDSMRVEFTGDMNNKSKDKEIYIEAANRAIKAIEQGKQVVFDTTNLTKEKRLPFIEAIKKEIPNANIQYKLMELNPELAKQRIKAQLERGENRANVPDSTIDRHAESYKQMLEDIKNEPISNYEVTPEQKQQAQQLYSQYLDTIFPDSKVKDIVYHGTDANFDNFDKKYFGFKEYFGGFHFGTKRAAKTRIIESSSKNILNVLLNITNINREIDESYGQQVWDTIIKENKVKGFDGIVYSNQYEDVYKDSYIVFEPEQIHILGSKQDIQGFKEFIGKSKPIDLREQLALELASKYGFSVEINTAKAGRFEDSELFDVAYDTAISEGLVDGSIEFNNRIEELTKDYGIARNSQYYSNLSAPGGTGRNKYEGNPDWEYQELEISTPLITPSIKGHAQFATNNGIGWARVWYNKKTGVVEIQEIQSDLFQKGRDKEDLIGGKEVVIFIDNDGTEIVGEKQSNLEQNQFLQLLNKDNNWITFFIKSIIQDSAKKGYEKVLFPTKDTIIPIESAGQFKNYKEAELHYKTDEWKKIDNELREELKKAQEKNNEEVLRIKQQIKDHQPDLLGTANTYENIGNILEKLFGKDNVKTITDEYGNQWREITLSDVNTDNILLSPTQMKMDFGDNINNNKSYKINQFKYTYNPDTKEVIHNSNNGDKIETNETQINKVLVEYAKEMNFETKEFNKQFYVKINDKVLNINNSKEVTQKEIVDLFESIEDFKPIDTLQYEIGIQNYIELINSTYIQGITRTELKEAIKSFVYMAGMIYTKTGDMNSSLKDSVVLHTKRFNTLKSIKDKLNNSQELNDVENKIYTEYLKQSDNLDKAIKIYEAVLNDSTTFEKYLKEEFKSLRFLNTLTESLEELDTEENTYEKTKYDDNARFEVDLKGKMSSDIRLFLFSILESNSDGTPMINSLGMRQTVDYNITFRQLRNLLANTILNETVLKQALAESCNPNMIAVLNKINELENNTGKVKDYVEKIKRELVEAFGLNNTNHIMVLRGTDYKTNQISDIIINSNHTDALNLLIKEFNNNFNIKLKDRFKTIEDIDTFERKIQDLFINGKAEDIVKTVYKALRNIGIDIDINILTKIYTDTSKQLGFNFYSLLNPVITSDKVPTSDKNVITNTTDTFYMRNTASLFDVFFKTLRDNVDKLDIVTPYTTTGSFNVSLKKLSKAIIKYNPTIYADSFLSIEGKKVFPFQLFTAQQIGLLRLKNNKDLLMKLNNISITSNSLLVNDLLLNPDSIEIHYLEGLKYQGSRKGKSRKHITNVEQDMIALKFISQGYFIDITHSDRKLTPVFKWKHFDIGDVILEGKEFISINDKSREYLERQYIAEANRIIKFKNTVQHRLAENELTYDKYTKNADKFVMFDILNKNNISKYLTQDEVDVVYPNGELVINNQSKELLWKAIKATYNDEITNMVKSWKGTVYNKNEDGTITINFDKNYSKYNNKYDINEVPSKALFYAAADLVLNQAIFTAESIRVLGGDPAYNKNTNDYQKRASRNGATYKLHSYLKPTISKITINDRNISSDYAKIFNSKTKTTAYESINSTDGAEYGTVLEMIEMKLAHNQIPFSVYSSIKQKYENSILDGTHYYELSNDEKQWIYQIEKPVMIGNFIDELNDTVRPVFRKSSILYLIPEITKGTPYDAYRIFMEKNHIDRMGHESADKYGSKKILKAFNEKGEFVIAENEDIESYVDRNIPRDYLGIQQDIPVKSIDGINYISQLHKLIGESINSPELKSLINRKDEIIKKIFNLKKDDLYAELGYRSDGSFNNKVFYEWLLKLAKNNDWTETEIESIALDENNNFKYPLHLNLFARQIEYNIMAYIKKSLVTHKIPGTSFIQSPSNDTKVTNLEEYNKYNKGLYFLPDYDKTKKLTHTLNEDGSIKRSQIIISWKFKDIYGNPLDITEFLNPDKTINMDKIPQELLKGILSRIPHQGHNSSTVYEVVGFLPSYMGNMMIIPDELINQTGSDFDIDKLYAYIYKNVYDGEKLIIVNRENLEALKDNKLKSNYREAKSKLKTLTDLNENNKALGKELVDTTELENEVNTLKFKRDLLNEFDELSILLNEYIEVLDNIFFSEEVINKSIQPLDKNDLKEEYAKLKIDKINTIVSWSYQRDSYAKQQAGKDLIAISSLLSIFNATIQGFTINLRSGDTPISLQIGSKTLTQMTGTSTSKYNGETRTVHDNITIAQSLFVDYAKDPIGFDLNLNDYVAPIAMFIIMLSDKNNKSLAWDEVIAFINDPEIKKYLNQEDFEDTENVRTFVKIEGLYKELSSYMNLIMFASRKGGGKQLTDYLVFDEQLQNISNTSFENIDKLFFETENGFYFNEIDKLINTLNNNYFAYNTPLVKTIRKNIEAYTRAPLYNEAFKEMVDELKLFLYSGFANKLNPTQSLNEIRTDLLKNNNITIQYYNLLEQYPDLKNNTFFKKLNIQMKNNISEIGFLFSEKDKSAIGENSLGLIELLEHESKDVQLFVKSLLSLSFSSGGLQNMNSIIDNIDTRLFDSLGLPQYINQFNYQDVDDVLVSKFITQYFQHNPKTLEYKKDSNNLFVRDEYANPYILINGNYVRLPKLGDDTRFEYNVNTDVEASIFDKTTLPNTTITIPIERLENNVTKSVKTDVLETLGNNPLETISKSKTEHFALLADVLNNLNIVNPKVELFDVSARGAYRNNTIYINPKEFYRIDKQFETEEVYLHEHLHHVMTDLLKRYNTLPDNVKQLIDKLKQLRIDARNILASTEGGKDVLNKVDGKPTELNSQNIKFYGLKNDLEFVSEIMNNVDFQKEMNDYIIEDKSILDKFIDLISKILESISKAIGKPINKNSILAEGVATVTTLLNEYNSTIKPAPEERNDVSIFNLRTNALAYTNDQINALNTFVNFSNDRKADVFVLKGYAGTGKSTIMENMINYLQYNNPNVKIGAACLLNKVVDRITTNLTGKTINPVTINTLHKFSYTPIPQDDGTVIFREKRDYELDYLFIDEASLINNEVADVIQRIARNGNTKLIYIGDSAQLESIGDYINLLNSRTNYKVELKEVKRTDNTSNVLKLATYIRDKGQPTITEEALDDIKYYMNSDKMVIEYTNLLRTQLPNESSIYITATNKERIRLNKQIHGSITGQLVLNSTPLMSLNNTPLMSNGTILNMTDAELKDSETITINGQSMTVYHMQGMYGEQPVAFMLVPDAEPNTSMAIRGVQSIKQEYGDTLKDIPVITYGYAVTGHKIQGLEFNHVFVDQNFNFNVFNELKVGDRIFDSKYNPHIITAENIQDFTTRMLTEKFYISDNHKWLYTAITRSKSKLYIKRLSLYNNIKNTELNNYFNSLTDKTSTNPIVDVVDIEQLRNRGNLFGNVNTETDDSLPFSPTISRDIENLISQIDNQNETIKEKIIASNDKAERIFMQEYSNLLEEESFILTSNGYTVNNIQNLNKKLIMFINHVLGKQDNFAFELEAVLNLTDIFTWDNILHYLPEDILQDDTNLIKQAFKQVAIDMADYNNKILNHTKEWMANLINKNRNKSLEEVTVEQLETVTNINLLQAETLDITHISHPLVQQISKYLANSSRLAEAHIGNMSKAIKKEWDKVKDLEFIKNYKLLKRDDKGKLTNRLISRYSSEWDNFISDYNQLKHQKYTVAKHSEDFTSTLLNSYKELLFGTKGLKANVDFIDINRILNDKDNYVKELKAKYNESFIDDVIEEAIDKYNAYLNNKEEIERFYQGQNLSVDELNNVMTKWENENNPLIMLEALNNEDISNMNPLRIEQLLKSIKSIPKHDRYYDNNYLEMLKDEKLYNFYKFYTNSMNKFLEYLPDTKTTFMNQYTLPGIHKDFLKGVFNQGLVSFFSSMGSNIIDSITNKKLKSLLQESEITNLNRDVITGELIPSIPVYFTNKLKTDDQSFELGHILELFGAMALNYKFKSEVEDYVKLMNRILKETKEVKIGWNGQPILDANGKIIEVKNGAVRLKDTVNYTINALLYGKKRTDDDTDTGIILYSLNPKEQARKTKEAKDLKNKMLQLELQYEDDSLGITPEEYNIEKTRLEQEYKALKGKSVDVSTSIDTLNTATQLKGLALSITSGISNLAFGLFSNILHSYGGVDFTTREYFNSLGYVLSHLRGNKSNKMLNLINQYNILFEINEIEYGRTLTRQHTLLNKIDLMIIQRKTELINQASAFVAMLNHQKVFVQELNKEVAVFDIYDETGNVKYESLKEQYNIPDSSLVENEYTKLRNKIIQVNKLNHGNYDPNSPVKIKATSIGRALMVFRSWMAEGFAQRWQGERQDDMLGRTVKGRYRTFADLGLKRSFLILLGALMRKKGVYDGLKEYEVENMRRNLAEIVMLFTLIGLSALLKAAWDDDDEDRPGATNILLNTMFRVEQDISFYVNPITFSSVIREPVPFVTTFQDFGKAIDKTKDYVLSDTYNSKHSPLYYWGKALPITSSYLRMEYQSDYLIETMLKNK